MRFEVLMDMLAEKLNMDPFDLRLKNVYREGSTTPTGQVPDSLSLPEMFEKLRPKYEEAKARAQKSSTDKHKCGVGLSVGIYGCGLDGPDTSEIKICLNPDNSVTLINSWEDHGQGADSGSLGTAHEALRPLGIAPENIHLVMNDTSRVPNSGPSGGSRQQVVTGQAIKAGYELLLGAMRKSDGSFRTYDEMKQENIPLEYTGSWTAPATNCDENAQGNPFAAYMYGVFMAEVCVELATGKTKMNRMTAVADVGKINNRLTVDGQMYGGLAQGIGLALSEDFEDLKKHASMMGAGFPYVQTIPDDIELIYVESPREHGPFGASGVGELPLPRILARICDQPCEAHCIRSQVDAPVAVGALERICAAGTEKDKKHFLPPAKTQTVGIWGAGLSSLVVAWDLTLKGYPVTVFHRSGTVGGDLLTLSEEVLPHGILAQEMERLTSFGVTFQEADAAEQVFKGDTAEQFDALYIGCDAPGEPFSHIDWESAGIPRTDAFSLATSEPQIFAGGFSRTGKQEVDKQAYPVAFAAQGRKAATSIDRLLSGVSSTAGREREGAVSTRLTTDISRVVPQKRILSAFGDTRADGGTVSRETAAREAGRCIQCDCSCCIRVCAYIAAFKGHPGQYAREIYNNAAIVMGERKANLLVNSCSLCGLCETVCPNDFSMADLCLEARRDMVEKGRMPVSAHAFALQEMAHASGSRCFFARHAPGKDRSDQPADRPDPGFSGRHDNLARAKHWMLSTLWRESESPQNTPLDESRPLHFAPGVRLMMVHYAMLLKI
jgi:heterodisulfide reductase subunit C